MLPVDGRAILRATLTPSGRTQDVRFPQALRRKSARVFFDFAARNSAGHTMKRPAIYAHRG
jgi:hypothetical protein